MLTDLLMICYGANFEPLRIARRREFIAGLGVTAWAFTRPSQRRRSAELALC
jgi:hypothetical protein